MAGLRSDLPSPERSAPLRILYITQHTHPDSGAPAARSYDFSRFWSDCGARVTVLASNTMSSSGCGRNRIRRLGRSSRSVRPVDTVNTIRIQAEFAVKATIVAARSARRWKPDVVLASVPALSVLVPALAAVSASGAALVVEVRDIWPDELIGLGFPASGLLPFLVEKVLAAAYRRADRVVTVTDGFRTRLLARGVPPDKVSVVPHGADLDTFKPLPAENWFRREHGWNDGVFVALYAGNMGRAQDVEALIESARFLPPSIQLVLVGHGNRRPAIERAVRWNSYGNISLLPEQPRAIVPWMYAAADVCLVPLRSVSALADAIPSKLTEIMACGRPIIAALHGAAADLVVESGAGAVVPPGQPESLAAALCAFSRKTTSELERMSRCARSFAEKNFDRRRHARRYLNLLQTVVQCKNKAGEKSEKQAQPLLRR